MLYTDSRQVSSQDKFRACDQDCDDGLFGPDMLSVQLQLSNHYSTVKRNSETGQVACLRKNAGTLCVLKKCKGLGKQTMHSITPRTLET